MFMLYQIPMSPSEYYKDKVRNIKDFDYTIEYRNKDLRKHPELYRVGR